MRPDKPSGKADPVVKLLCTSPGNRLPPARVHGAKPDSHTRGWCRAPYHTVSATSAFNCWCPRTQRCSWKKDITEAPLGLILGSQKRCSFCVLFQDSQLTCIPTNHPLIYAVYGFMLFILFIGSHLFCLLFEIDLRQLTCTFWETDAKQFLRQSTSG